MMLKHIVALFLLVTIIASKGQVKSSDVEIVVKTADEDKIIRQSNLISPKLFILKATQSSKIYVNIRLDLSSKAEPELVAGRLIHETYSNITRPVIGVENKGTGRFELKFDIGDPEVIQPINGKYELEILVAGDELSQQYRQKIGTFHIVFLKASTAPHPSALYYESKPEIIFKLDGAREDPQSTFTLFVVLLIVISFIGFLGSLSHLKVNISLFPSSGTGAILNILFLGLIGGIVYVLVKFWLTWTFIETVKVLSVLVIPTVIVGNYAILSINKPSKA